MPFTMIGSIALAAAFIAQGQEPAFDVQVAVPAKTNHNRFHNGLSGPQAPPVALSSGSQLLQPIEPPSTGSPSASFYQTSPPAGSAPQVVQSYVPGGYGQGAKTPATSYAYQTPATSALPGGQIWTWGPRQMKEFASASGAYRERLRAQVGVPGREFSYYVTPYLAPGSSMQLYQSSPNGLPPGTFWYVTPGQNGQSPRVFQLVPQAPKDGTGFLYVQPNQDGKTPQWYEVKPGQSFKWDPKLFQGKPGEVFKFDPKVFQVKPGQTFKWDPKLFQGKPGDTFKFDPKVFQVKPGQTFKWDPKLFQGMPGEAFKFDPKLFQVKPGQSFKWDPKLFQGKPGEHGFLYELQPGGPQVQLGPPNNVSVEVQSAGALFKTLTPHQKELQKTRGYLRFEDLTAKQKEMLTHPKGQFEIDYHDGKQDLIIKN